MAEVPRDDLTGFLFRDPLWLQHIPLTAATALDYFAKSQFYDRQCNNEVCKMQKLEPTPENLRHMIGTEYTLSLAQEPTLFVVRKFFREGPRTVTALATYYILDGTIYQSPSVYRALSSRMVRAASHIQTAFETISKHAQMSVTSRHGYVWDFSKEEDPHATGKTETENPRKPTLSNEDRARIDKLLVELQQKLEKEEETTAASNPTTPATPAVEIPGKSGEAATLKRPPPVSDEDIHKKRRK